MSNVEAAPRELLCGGDAAAGPVHEFLIGREVVLGTRGTVVNRTLPNRDRRMVGAWCFVDHYGPDDISGQPGMRLPPHPHIGLQTVSWLVDGEVLHRDSLGSRQVIHPGELNLMTSGRNIAHAEDSPPEHSPLLHGIQLWVALPGPDRNVEPHFEHHPQLPGGPAGKAHVTVFMGELDGAVSPARTYSPLVGAEIGLEAGGDVRLPLRRDFEHAVLPVAGAVEVDGVELEPGPLLYLGTHRSDLRLRSDPGGRALLLGGEPFEELIVMWWNFVGRSHDEIVQARDDWMAGRRFGTVAGDDRDPLPAPPMPTTILRPRGRRP